MMLLKKITTCRVPDSMRHKDINDMIIGNIAISEINDIISTNTCSKLEP